MANAVENNPQGSWYNRGMKLDKSYKISPLVYFLVTDVLKRKKILSELDCRLNSSLKLKNMLNGFTANSKTIAFLKLNSERIISNITSARDILGNFRTYTIFFIKKVRKSFLQT